MNMMCNDTFHHSYSTPYYCYNVGIQIRLASEVCANTSGKIPLSGTLFQDRLVFSGNLPYAKSTYCIYASKGDTHIWKKEHITVELDYLRNFTRNRSLLVRFRGEKDENLFSYDRENEDVDGQIILGEIELGIGKTFVWGHNRTTEFGLYLQSSTALGYQDFYGDYYQTKGLDYEDDYKRTYDRTVTHTGLSGGLFFTGGLHLQKNRFIMKTGVSLGSRFNRADSYAGDPVDIEPEITLGCMF